MRKFNIDFNKTFKYVIIAYAVIFVIGGIFSAFGIDLDINFSGGTKISYSYTGDLELKDIEAIAEKTLDTKFSASKSTALAGNTATFEIALSGKNALSTEKQAELTSAFETAFKDNEIELYNSNSVSPTIADTFFAKSMVAVLITALLVVIYVGIRFRKIGGISAALTALCALVLDVLISFFTCVIFGLQIDSNYIAVVLTILGYSLNDTIVIYDRVRENRKLDPSADIADVANKSIKQSVIRNIITTVTTLSAVLTIVVVSEIFGLTTLRTFAIPMAFGLVSGAVTSLFVAVPLWVIWKKHKSKKAKA